MGVDGVGNNAFIYSPKNNGLDVTTQNFQTSSAIPDYMKRDGSIFDVSENVIAQETLNTQDMQTTPYLIDDNYSTNFLEQNTYLLDQLTIAIGGDITQSTEEKLNILKSNYTNVQIGGVTTDISSTFPSWVDDSTIVSVTNNSGITDFYSGDTKVATKTIGESNTIIETFASDTTTVSTRQDVSNSGNERTIETFVPDHTKTIIRGNVTTTVNPETNQIETVKTNIGNACIQTDTYMYNSDGSYTITTSGNEVHPENNGVRNYNTDGTRFTNEALADALTNGKAEATLNGRNGEIGKDGFPTNILVSKNTKYSEDGFPTKISINIQQGTTDLTYAGNGEYTNNAKDLTYRLSSDANGNITIDTEKGVNRDANLETYRQIEETKLLGEAEQRKQNLEIANKRINLAMDKLDDLYDSTMKDFENYISKEGASGWISDVVSHIWNNDLGEKIGIATGNTESDVREYMSAVKTKLNNLRELKDKNPTEFINEYEKMGKEMETMKNKMISYQNSQEMGKEVVGYTFDGITIAASIAATVATGGAAAPLAVTAFGISAANGTRKVVDMATGGQDINAANLVNAGIDFIPGGAVTKVVSYAGKTGKVVAQVSTKAAQIDTKLAAKTEKAISLLIKNPKACKITLNGNKETVKYILQSNAVEAYNNYVSTGNIKYFADAIKFDSNSTTITAEEIAKSICAIGAT